VSDYLHFIEQKHNGYWSARCLDFTLYAVGDTQLEARAKLNAEISEFLFDALEGEDRAFAANLLLRRAPWQEWATYYVVSFIQNCWVFSDRIGKAFKDTIPQGPYRHA